MKVDTSRRIVAIAGGLALLITAFVFAILTDSATSTIVPSKLVIATSDRAENSELTSHVDRRSERPRVTSDEATVSESETVSKGSLVVLDLDSVSPVADLELRVRGHESDFSTLADRDGRVQVPAGEWMIDPQGGWELVGSNPVEVKPGSESVVWVTRPSDIVVTVVDLNGAPVSDALLSVFNLADSGTQLPSPLPASSHALQRVRTNSSGVGHLSRVPVRGSLLVVRNERFIPATQRLCGESELTVALTPCSTGERRVRFVDSLDGSPIFGVIGRTTFGIETSPSSSDGSLSLPNCASERELFIFLCENYYPTEAQKLSNLPPIVELTPASSLEVHIAGIDPSKTTRMLIESGLGPSSIQAIGSNPVAMDARPVQVVRIPSNREVRIQVLSSDGRSAQAKLFSTTSRSQLDLTLAVGPVLDIVIAADSRDREADALCSMAVEFPKPFGVLKLNGVSAFRVPLPHLARRLEVRSSGSSPIRLAPLEGWTGDLGGSLTLELRAETSLSCTVVNRLGEAVPGAAVAVRSQVVKRAFAQFPELHGDLPTNHPGWVRSTPPIAYAITGAEGTALVRGLTYGANRVNVSPPNFAIADGFHFDAWAAPQEFTASGKPVELTVIMSRPKLVVIEAFDRYTGQGINRFRVSNRAWRSSAPPSSFRWSGLVPEELASLEISVPGYARESLVLDRSEAEVYRVEMLPIDGMKLRIEPAPGVAATDFGILIAFGRQESAAFYPQWSTRLKVGVDSPGELHAPMSVGTELHILEVSSGKQTFRPSPTSFLWASGGELIVSIRP